jgi:hypothetical protein
MRHTVSVLILIATCLISLSKLELFREISAEGWRLRLSSCWLHEGRLASGAAAGTATGIAMDAALGGAVFFHGVCVFRPDFGCVLEARKTSVPAPVRGCKCRGFYVDMAVGYEHRRFLRVFIASVIFFCIPEERLHICLRRLQRRRSGSLGQGSTVYEKTRGACFARVFGFV